jgi:hypothetical protein
VGLEADWHYRGIVSAILQKRKFHNRSSCDIRFAANCGHSRRSDFDARKSLKVLGPGLGGNATRPG